MVNKHLLKRSLLGTFVALSGLMAQIGCGGGTQVTPYNNNASADKRGEDIVAEYLKRDGAPFRKIRIRFTIKTEGQPDKIYELDNWRKQTPEGTTTLSQILKPVEDSDLGSLTLEPKGKSATVTTYVPSHDEFRETPTTKMFFGGLTAGELLGDWDKFTYKLLGEKEVGGRKCYEVEGKFKPLAETVVSWMTVLFRQDNYGLVEVHFFDNNDKEIRTYRVTNFNEDPVHPYAAKTEVDNRIYHAKITIEILNIEFPATLDDAMFTRDKLRSFAKK
ncbi:hypothetical protein BH10ACI3_BH10ACI3_01720 [soil metagenome]